MSTVLDKIVDRKKVEVSEFRARVSIRELTDEAEAATPSRGFIAALSASSSTLNLIAEVKRASPSAGVIREDFDPVQIARIYESAGAHAISVLTDRDFFQGHIDFLANIRASVQLPILRKDFIIDELQILEARAAGADAVLLIAEILDEATLNQLLKTIHSWGMDALVELYDPANLDMVVRSGAELIGVNNRDLRSFVTDLSHTLDLVARIPSDRILVSESGIHTREDVLRLKQGGAKAMLVGESIMRSSDMAAQIAELLTVPESA